MKVKTESLTGLHLDVAVAIAIGGEVTAARCSGLFKWNASAMW